MSLPRPALALVVAALCALIYVACSGGEAPEAAKQEEPRPERVSTKEAARKPNVIFIYTDDQNFADFTPRVMPKTHRLINRPGSVFTDFVVATPLCCPSRASFLTGDYPHNTGVFSNRGGYRNLEGKFNTLPVWMHNAGYRTAWVGKYLQGYPQTVDDPYVAAPGIDEWHATFLPRYYKVKVADNGKKRSFGKKPRDYYTSVVTRVATRLIADEAKRRRPLFMTFNHLAPHTGTGKGARCRNIVPPARRDVDLFKDAKVPRTPNYNEKDVSDKPDVVSRPRLSPERRKKIDLAHGCRLASLRAVDRSIGAIHRAVKRTGELDNTVFFFTSDNGLLQGQHRLGGKNIPYEEAIKQPLAILAGRKAIDGRQVSKVPQLTANIDLAPTILDIGDARPCARPGNCRKIDGLSMLPLLRGREGQFPVEREILIEGGKGGNDCSYAGVRTPHVSFIRHAELLEDGTCDRNAGLEFYDLDGALTGKADPYQLHSLTSPETPGYDDPRVRAELRRLKARLGELRDCSGRDCR